jgi:hypothetical protein
MSHETTGKPFKEPRLSMVANNRIGFRESEKFRRIETWS